MSRNPWNPNDVTDTPLFRPRSPEPPDNGTAPSRAAASAIAPLAATIRETIRAHVAKVGPSTCEEVERALGLKHQTASARIRELEQGGALEICGTRRTESGVPARLYRVR